jgi:hypothetical protein
MWGALFLFDAISALVAIGAVIGLIFKLILFAICVYIDRH